MSGVPVFPRISSALANREARKIARAAGITKHLTFHTSRHSCAMNLLYMGFALEEVGKVLGQADLKSTQIYARMLPERVARVARRVFGRTDSA